MTTRPLSEARATPSAGWGWRTLAVVFAGLLWVPLARIWEVAPDLGHGWAAPILMAYLWWERWSLRPGFAPPGAGGAPQFSGGLMASLALLALSAIPLRLILTPYPVWPTVLTLYVGILVVLAFTLTHRYFGWAGVKWLGGPLILLPGVMPWPGIFERGVILPLRHGIATLVTEISNLLGQPAIASGTSIRLSQHWVGIDEACGGIRSLQACVTTALFFGEWLKLSIGRRVLLVGVGILAALTGNLGRVGFLTWCATGPEGRLDQWHDPAGWAALGFSLIVTGWTGWKWSRNGATLVSSPPAPARRTPAIAALKPSIIALVAVLVAGEVGTRWWYARGDVDAVPADGLHLWSVRIPVESNSFVRQELSEAGQDILQPDAFLSGSWRGSDGALRMVNYVEWHEGQAARGAPFLHNPTVCLPNAGATLERELGTLQIPWDRGFIPFHTYLFRQGGDVLVVGFAVWDPSRGGPLRLPADDGTWTGWIAAQWREVIEAREHQPAQMLAFGIVGQENQPLLADEIRNLMVPAKQIGRISQPFSN